MQVFNILNILIFKNFIVPYLELFGFYYEYVSLTVVIYKLVCSKTLTKFALRRPNPMLKTNISRDYQS